MRAIIIHRWSGKPDSDWYGSVADKLKEDGFLVDIPQMPSPEAPKIDEWVEKLKDLAPNPDNETVFIGHSIGCQTILRYLEQIGSKTKIRKIILVAPWFNLQNLDMESAKIARPWIETPIDFNKVKTHIPSITCIFSDNDTWVSLSDKEIFKSLLDAKVIVEHNKGHFTEEDRVTSFPLVVQEVVTL